MVRTQPELLAGRRVQGLQRLGLERTVRDRVFLGSAARGLLTIAGARKVLGHVASLGLRSLMWDEGKKNP